MELSPRVLAAIDVIRRGVEDRHIRNAEFKDAKFTIDSAVYKTQDKLSIDKFRPKEDESGSRYVTDPRWSLVTDMKWDIGSNLHSIKSGAKKLAKMKKQVEALDDAEVTEFYEEVTRFVNFWIEIANLADEAKQYIVMGRKILPPEERKTKIRTFENTGTCPCCFRNVKMRYGKIVDHGFTVNWGSGYGRQGNCFGVDFEPFELSPEGTRRYSAAIQKMIEKERANIARWNAQPEKITVKPKNRFEKEIDYVRGTPEYARVIQNFIMNAERAIRYMQSDVDRLDTLVREWKKKPLPAPTPVETA